MVAVTYRQLLHVIERAQKLRHDEAKFAEWQAHHEANGDLDQAAEAEGRRLRCMKALDEEVDWDL